MSLQPDCGGSLLKLWPQKRWKQIVFVVVLILIVAFVAFAVFGGLLLSGVLSREVVSEIDVMNADGNKTSLVVYQPGFSSFRARATTGTKKATILSRFG